MNPLRRFLGSLFGGRRRTLGGDAIWGRATSQGGLAVDAFSNHSTVYAATTKIAQALASIPWTVRSGTDESPTEVLDGPWYDLFHRPHPYLTRTELAELTATYLVLSGECFWVLDDGSGGIISPTAIPRYIWPKSGAHVREITNGAGMLTGWRISGVRDNTTREYPLHAVIQLRDMVNPEVPYRGIGRLQAAMASVSSDYQALLFNRSWYENGANPSLVLSVRENQSVAPDDVSEVRKFLDDGWRGAARAGKILLIPGPFKPESSPVKFADMQFLEGLKWGKIEIAKCFGVPVALLGDAADVNYNTMRHTKRIFFEQNILVMAQKIEDAIEVQLIEPRLSAKDVASGRRGKGRAVWIEFDTDAAIPAMQEDVDARLTQAAKATAMGFTKNEVNEKYELGFESDDEMGDLRFLNGTLVSELIAPPEPVPAALAPFQGAPPPSSPDIAPAKEETAEDTGNPDKGKEPPQRSRVLEPRERRDRFWEAHSRALLPHEGAFRGRMQRYLYARRKEVLALLSGERTVRTASSDVERFLQEARARWDKQLVGELDGPYRAAATAGVEQVGREIGGLTKFSAADPRIAEFLAAKALRVVTVNQTLIDSLRTTLIEGISSGETTQELQERVRIGFGTSRASALRIARTEAAQTVNGARQVAMEGEGIEKSEWISSRDELVRDSCAGADGEIQPLGTPFSNGLRYPADVAGAPEKTINCRCTSAPSL